MSLTMILGQNHLNFFIRKFITRVERTDKRKQNWDTLWILVNSDLKIYLRVADKWINFVIWRRFMIKISTLWVENWWSSQGPGLR